ncbi:27140_t:CDS:1, partial [Racocetra persica]
SYDALQVLWCASSLMACFKSYGVLKALWCASSLMIYFKSYDALMTMEIPERTARCFIKRIHI